MDEDRDLKLTNHQKTRLLSLGLSLEEADDPTDPDDKRADLLYEILAETLPVADRTMDVLPPLLKGQSQKLESIAGRSLGDLILGDQTEVATIRRIKEYTKDRGASANSEIQQDAFMATYLGAIANALVYHHKKISQHSQSDLKEYFRSFSQKTWVLKDLRDLLREAFEQCEQLERM